MILIRRMADKLNEFRKWHWLIGIQSQTACDKDHNRIGTIQAGLDVSCHDLELGLSSSGFQLFYDSLGPLKLLTFKGHHAVGGLRVGNQANIPDVRNGKPENLNVRTKKPGYRCSLLAVFDTNVA